MELILLFIIVIIFISYVIFQIYRKRQIFFMQFKMNSNNYIIYILSLLVPLAGIIVGSIKLSKDDNLNRSTGINCIILSIISMIIGAIIIFK